MRSAIILLLFFNILPPVWAQTGGSHIFNFLNNPQSAQAAAHGGVLVAHLSERAELLWQNPANLRPESHMQGGISYANYFSDISAASASFCINTNQSGLFAILAQRMGYGDFIAADETGVQTGSFGANDNAFGLCWAYPLLDSLLYVGVGTRLIFSNYEQYNSSALSTDWGLSYKNKKHKLAIGLTVRNLGKQLKPFREGSYEALPLQINLGIYKKLDHAPFAFSLNLHNLQDWQLDYDSEINDDKKSFGKELVKHINVGVEFSTSEKFFAAISYNYKRRSEMLLESSTGMSGFAWGFGFSIKMFRVSFANTYFHRAGSTQFFSLSTRLAELSKH